MIFGISLLCLVSFSISVSISFCMTKPTATYFDLCVNTRVHDLYVPSPLKFGNLSCSAVRKQVDGEPVEIHGHNSYGHSHWDEQVVVLVLTDGRQQRTALL